MIDNKDSKKRYRADVLVEERAAQMEAAGKKEEADALVKKLARLLEADDLKGCTGSDHE